MWFRRAYGSTNFIDDAVCVLTNVELEHPRTAVLEHRIEHRVPGIFDRGVVIAEDSRKRL